MSFTRDGEKMAALARNFSEGGLLLVVPRELRIAHGNILELEIKLPDDKLEDYLRQPPLTVSGRVVRVEHRGDSDQLGIEFLNVGPQLLQQLRSALQYYQLAA